MCGGVYATLHWWVTCAWYNVDVYLQEDGVKDQQKLRHLEVALREGMEREAGLQERLDKTALELKHTKADLQIVIEKGHQDLRESKAREAGLQRRLDEAEVELGQTLTQGEQLLIMVEAGHQKLRESVEREMGLKVRLEEASSDVVDAKAQVQYIYR